MTLPKFVKMRKNKFWKIMKENKDVVHIIIALVIILIILQPLTNWWVGTNLNPRGKQNCPYAVAGNPASDFTIKYFSSPSCPACWKWEFVLRKLLKEHGSSFFIEKYDLRVCFKEVEQYGIVGTPSYVLIPKKANKEFIHFGYLSYDNMEQTICKWTGDC